MWLLSGLAERQEAKAISHRCTPSSFFACLSVCDRNNSLHALTCACVHAAGTESGV